MSEVWLVSTLFTITVRVRVLEEALYRLCTNNGLCGSKCKYDSFLIF